MERTLDNTIINVPKERMKQLSKYNHMIIKYSRKYARDEITYLELKNHLVKIKKGIYIIERENNLLPNAWFIIIELKFMIYDLLISNYTVTMDTPINERIELE